jgi:hypothetical protein
MSKSHIMPNYNFSVLRRVLRIQRLDDSGQTFNGSQLTSPVIPTSSLTSAIFSPCLSLTRSISTVDVFEASVCHWTPLWHRGVWDGYNDVPLLAKPTKHHPTSAADKVVFGFGDLIPFHPPSKQ